MKNLINIAYYEKRYAITSTGHVLNLANNQLLKLRINKNGYLIVTLAGGKEGISEQKSVHRLVALHFIPNPYQYSQVNHKDGNKANNCIDNIEWCTAQQNIQHALKTGLRKGYLSADDKEKYLYQVLDGVQVKNIAKQLERRPETLHKMLRDTAKRLNIKILWDIQMQENRRNAAIRNLAKINN